MSGYLVEVTYESGDVAGYAVIASSPAQAEDIAMSHRPGAVEAASRAFPRPALTALAESRRIEASALRAPTMVCRI